MAVNNLYSIMHTILQYFQIVLASNMQNIEINLQLIKICLFDIWTISWQLVIKLSGLKLMHHAIC